MGRLKISEARIYDSSTVLILRGPDLTTVSQFGAPDGQNCRQFREFQPPQPLGDASAGYHRLPQAPQRPTGATRSSRRAPPGAPRGIRKHSIGSQTPRQAPRSSAAAAHRGSQKPTGGRQALLGTFRTRWKPPGACGSIREPAVASVIPPGADPHSEIPRTGWLQKRVFGGSHSSAPMRARYSNAPVHQEGSVAELLPLHIAPGCALAPLDEV